MKPKTKEQLLADNDRLSKDAGVLHQALNDVINQRVTWFRAGRYRLGISRENGPEGGILIYRFEDYTCAYYWENWYPDIRDFPLGDYKTNKEAYVLRDCAFKIHEHILQKQRHEKETQNGVRGV